MVQDPLIPKILRQLIVSVLCVSAIASLSTLLVTQHLSMLQYMDFLKMSYHQHHVLMVFTPERYLDYVTEEVKIVQTQQLVILFFT